MTDPDPKTAGLRRSARERSDSARARIERAIRELRKKNQPVNVNAVHNQSEVSRKTIYKHKDLLERIRALKTADMPPDRPDVNVQTGEGSIVAALRRQLAAQTAQSKSRVSQLKAELAEKEEALAAAYGEIERLRQQSGPRRSD